MRWFFRLYFIYLYDIIGCLDCDRHDNDEIYKLTLYKMAEFKDGIPIMYQLFCVNFAD